MLSDFFQSIPAVINPGEARTFCTHNDNEIAVTQRGKLMPMAYALAPTKARNSRC